MRARIWKWVEMWVDGTLWGLVGHEKDSVLILRADSLAVAQERVSHPMSPSIFLPSEALALKV